MTPEINVVWLGGFSVMMLLDATLG